MDEAEIVSGYRNAGIEIRADGYLVASCLCGGNIRVRPDSGDEGITLAVQHHNGSLIHTKAREVWESGAEPLARAS